MLGGECLKLGEDLPFERRELLLGVEDLLLVLLQLRGDIALGVAEGLLPDVVLGDTIAVGVGDLQVVTEDAN
jgi:hypothetical protein